MPKVPVHTITEEGGIARISKLRGDIGKLIGQIELEEDRIRYYKNIQDEKKGNKNSHPGYTPARLSEEMFKCRQRVNNFKEGIMRAEEEIAFIEGQIASGYASDDDSGEKASVSGKATGYEWAPSEPAPLRYNERKAMEKYYRNKKRQEEQSNSRARNRASAARYGAENIFQHLEGIFHSRRAAQNAATAAAAAAREEDMRRQADLAAQKRAEEELLVAQGRNAHRRADAAYNLTEGVLDKYMSPPYRRRPFGAVASSPFSRRNRGGSRSKKTRKRRA